MRVGLISDTHGHLRSEVFERLAGVDRILHAGDIGGPEIVSDLAALAPVAAVWGNTDGWALRDIVPEHAEMEVEGVRFAVAHGHRVPTFEKLLEQFPAADVIVHGHSHVPRCDRVAGRWLLNPGSAGPGGQGWAPSLAIATIDEVGETDGAARDRLEVVHLDLRTGAPLDL
jgi:putative phosphoesterase